MNKLIYTFTLLLLGFASVAQNRKPAPNPSKPLVPGFRDLNWGVHIDSAWIGKQKLNFIKSNISRENVYYLENDDLTVGTVNLNSIFYYFTDRGRFTKVLLVAIFPRSENFSAQRGKITQVNQVIRKLADGKNVLWVDFGHEYVTAEGLIPTSLMPDYLHLSPKGYQIWAEAIEDQLSAIVGDGKIQGAESGK